MSAATKSALSQVSVDLEYVLKWIVGVGTAFALAPQLAKGSAAQRGWVWVLTMILVVLVAGVYLDVPGTGYTVCALWLILVGLPLFATRRQVELLSRNQWAGAAFWARITAWFHPFDGVTEHARLMQARALAEGGQFDKARSSLRTLNRTHLAELARLEALRLDGDWSAIVDHVDAQPVGTRDLGIAPLYLQALGETGDVARMLTWFRKLPPALKSQRELRLRVAAYAGLAEPVELSLASPELALPDHVSAYLTAVALQTAGNRAAARPLLEKLQAHPVFTRQALRRLTRPLEPVQHATLSAQGRAVLNDIEQRLAWDREGPPDRPAKPIATWIVAATLLAVFLVSVPGGTTNRENLIEMGALILPQELRPGAWRLVSAGFVHFGATHLAMNLVALLLLGSALERLWGRVTLLGSFLGGSVGAYWLATLALPASLQEPKELLGASAGVFGLVGAMMMFEMTGALLGHTRLFNRRLLALAVLVLAQLVFDWFTPIVSSFLHLAGMAFGATMALPLAIRHWRRVEKDHHEISGTQKATATLPGKL